MLWGAVTQYKERHSCRTDKDIRWPVIAAQVAAAGIQNRNDKSCRLRQELLNPLPAHAVHSQLFTSRETGRLSSQLTLSTLLDALLTVVTIASLISTHVDVMKQSAAKALASLLSLLFRAGCSRTYQFCFVGGQAS